MLTDVVELASASDDDSPEGGDLKEVAEADK
jgi:hypothetical protein